MAEKRFSQACENNKQPILQVLKRYLTAPGDVLEIGSGTGQHAVYFAEQLPQLVWHCSDLPDNHASILAWLAEYTGTNLRAPFALNVAAGQWPATHYHAVFTANTVHIMSWPEVQEMIQGVAEHLHDQGMWIVYGPFNYNGAFTSESNARFNDWLKEQAPHRAIRDFEAVRDAAAAAGLQLLEDAEMPANNRCLVFRKG